LRNFKPARLLIEPSGAGHAADIVDTLAQYEAQRALVLDSVICLVDALDAARILAARAAGDLRAASEWSQIQSADVLLLSKPDLAGDAERQAFAGIAAAQYPVKGYVGSCLNGELPPESLRHFTRVAGFSQVRDFAAAAPVATAFAIGGLVGGETQVQQLGMWAIHWILPRELTFSRTVIEPRLGWLLDAYPGRCRLKAVLRTGPGPSWLIQSHGQGLAGQDSAYRRDSRVEMVFSTAPTAEFLDLCRALLRDAAFVR
jgi:G3E family GTPase